jgi:lipoprotein-releasing system ATP-binding protein
MLSVKQVSKSYVQRGTVLDNLTFEVQAGDSVAIMGPSGSGKTTLLNIIGLLDKPDQGSVVFRNQPVAGFSSDEAAAYRNRNIGFVFQDHLLLPYLTVADNIFLPLLAAKPNDKEYASLKDYIDDLMMKTGIADLSGKYPFQISGGEAQRVALVRALANKPSILLADEPTGSLDQANALILGNLLVAMNIELGTTIILATHSAGLSDKMKRQLRLESGKLV